MTLRILALFLFFFTAKLSYTQNLVYNPSFDEITQCNTTNFMYYDYVVGWVNPCFTNGHTSDYYNTTCPPLPNMDKPPYHGTGLFGLATYSSVQTYPAGITNFHEFVRGTLTTPLTVGSTYCVSFKVSPLNSSFVSNNIGALFTNVPYDLNHPYEALTNNAHVYSSSIITDTSWTTVSGSFVADSAYQYIMLGNFFADNLTSHASGGAYYWVDDVYVVLDPNGDCSALNNIPSNVSQDQSICAGETFTLPGGTVVNTSGIYIDTLQASNGADSIITTTLTVVQPITNTINASICPGDQYNFGGNSLTASGTYTDTLTAASTSCDSIVVLNLTILPVIPPTEILETICAGSSYPFAGNSLTVTGTYTDTLISASTSCDSIVVLDLTVLPLIPPTEIFDTICTGSTYLFNGNSLTAPGTYTADLQNQQGCDSLVTLHLAIINAPAAPEVATNLPLPCYNQEFTGVIINPDAALTYSWYTDTTGTAIGQGVEFTKVIDENTLVIYVGADNGTCSSVFTIVPVVIDLQFNADFEMPNVITPNNDGVNDEIDFEVIFGGCITYEVSIFNRWGNLVSSGEKTFNGKDSKGRDLVDGIYFYMLKYDGMERHGFIHLLR